MNTLMGFSSSSLIVASRNDRSNNRTRRGALSIAVALGLGLATWQPNATATVMNAQQIALADLLEDVWSARRIASSSSTTTANLSLKLSADIRLEAKTSTNAGDRTEAIPRRTLTTTPATFSDATSRSGEPAQAVKRLANGDATVKSGGSAYQAVERPATFVQTRVRQAVIAKQQDPEMTRRKEDPNGADAPSVTLRDLLRSFVNVRGPSGLPDLGVGNNASELLFGSSRPRNVSRERDSILDTAISSQFVWLVTSIVQPSLELDGSVRFSFAGFGDFMLQVSSDHHYVALSERNAGMALFTQSTVNSILAGNGGSSSTTAATLKLSITEFVKRMLLDLVRSPVFYIILFSLFVWCAYLMLARAANR